MRVEEKLAIFEQVGIDDEYLAEVDELIESGEYYDDRWETVVNPNAEPVSFVVRMMPHELAELDRRADELGKTRNQLVRELLTSPRDAA